MQCCSRLRRNTSLGTRVVEGCTVRAAMSGALYLVSPGSVQSHVSNRGNRLTWQFLSDEVGGAVLGLLMGGFFSASYCKLSKKH